MRLASLNSVQVKLKVKRKTESKSRSKSVGGTTDSRPALLNSVQVKIEEVKRKTETENKSKKKCWRDDTFETCFAKFSPGKN